MQANSIVQDPNYGLIAVVAVIPSDTEQLVIFVNQSGQTVLGVFDLDDNALGQPVRWSKAGGLYSFDFPGASASTFVVGPSGNVTNC